MTKRAAVWAGVWTIGGFIDFTLNRRHDGSTFSECVRWAFHTEHPVGRTIFTAALVGGAYAFHRHICRE